LDWGFRPPIIATGQLERLMSDDALPVTEPRADGAYRVLARKYRPTTFAEMIGQDALVRTLSNAIASGRLAHAFVLTGVRGVGKTTTARIIARALNCVGPDGTGGPTVAPCGVCEPCRSILAERNVDVMEMDAASRTGVEDIREIIDGVRYGPVSARFKIYIIDEVHMLSKSAFNALLKTLEEPPPHVKFVFATTEIRKVPITVLSRCQRFDLRRIDADLLAAHFTAIVKKEGVTAEPEAISMIARAADGSARDGLSLLDQAIALGAGTVTAEQVRDMLGLADRTRIIDLFETLMRGDARAALEILDDLHRGGADPLVILQDLLDFTHFLTRIRLVPELAHSAAVPEAERVRGAALAATLGMPVLSRTWQMLLKGIGEVQDAPSPGAALEMVLIRLIHAAHLPTPGDILKRLESGEYGNLTAPAPAPAGPSGNGASGRGRAAGGLAVVASAPRSEPVAETVPEAAPDPRPAGNGSLPQSYRELVALFEDEPLIYGHLYSSVHLVRYEPGRIEIRPQDGAPQNLASQVMSILQQRTGERWMVTLSREEGEPTLSEQDRQAVRQAKLEAADHPTVRAVLEAFPGAVVEAVHDLSQVEETGAPFGVPEMPADTDESDMQHLVDYMPDDDVYDDFLENSDR